MPKPKPRGKSGPKKSPKKKQPKKLYDWPRIRVAREVEGKSFKQLARDFGPHETTIAARSRRESWRDPADVAADLASKASDELAARFIAQEASAVFANRTRAHSITSRILGRVEKRLDVLERKETGAVDGDEALELRRLVLIANTAEQVDARVAGLKDGGDWRSDAGSGVADSETSSDRVLDALQRLEGAAPARR